MSFGVAEQLHCSDCCTGIAWHDGIVALVLLVRAGSLAGGPGWQWVHCIANDVTINLH